MSISFIRYRILNGIGDNAYQPHCYCSMFVPESGLASPTYIAAGYQYGEFRIHEIEALRKSTNQVVVQSERFAFSPHPACVVDIRAVVLGSDTILITLDGCGEVLGWSWKELLEKMMEPQRSRPIPLFRCTASMNDTEFSSIALNEHTHQLITGDRLGKWYCWDINRLSSLQCDTPLQVYSAHDNKINSMDCYNGILASSSNDGTVCLWDIRSESCISAIDPLTSKVLPLNKSQRSKQCSNIPATAVQFDKSGRQVVAASRECHLTVWNVRSDTGQCAFETASVIYSLDTTKDLIFCAGLEGRIYQYSTLSAESMEFVSSNMEDVNDIHISRHEPETVLVSGNAGNIEMFNLLGDSLGFSSLRNEISTNPEISDQQMGDISPISIGEVNDQRHPNYHLADEDVISIDDIFEENCDHCDSTSEEDYCSEPEDVRRYVMADNYSSVIGLSETNDGSLFSSDEEPGSEFQYPNLAAYGYEGGPHETSIQDEDMDHGEDEFSSYSVDSPEPYGAEPICIDDFSSGEGTSEDEDSVHE